MPRRSAAAAAVRYPRVAANRQLPPQVHARRSVHHQVSSLPFGSSGSRPRCFTSSPVHVSAPFGALGTTPGIRPVIQQRRHGGVATACWFPVGFRPPALLLGHPVPAREFRSPYGRPTDPPADESDPVGVSVFRTHEIRPGWVPSLPRDGGAFPTSLASLIGACRFSTASPVPRWNLPPAELLITRHTKIHLRSPVRSSPRPSSPGRTGTLRLSPWASHPVVTHSARQSGDGPLDTGPSHILNKRPPIERDHSPRATSRRTASINSSTSRRLSAKR